MNEDIHKIHAQMSKANHIANWCCAQFSDEEYVTAVLAAIQLVEKGDWSGICSGAKKPGSSEDVRILVLEELRRRIGPATIPEWGLAQQKAKEADLFKGLPTE